MAISGSYAYVASNDLYVLEMRQCGDGTVTTDEACDDGNTSDGDGCSATCVVEEITEDAGEEIDGGATDGDDEASADDTDADSDADTGEDGSDTDANEEAPSTSTEKTASGCSLSFH